MRHFSGDCMLSRKIWTHAKIKLCLLFRIHIYQKPGSDRIQIWTEMNADAENCFLKREKRHLFVQRTENNSFVNSKKSITSYYFAIFHTKVRYLPTANVQIWPMLKPPTYGQNTITIILIGIWCLRLPYITFFCKLSGLNRFGKYM